MSYDPTEESEFQARRNELLEEEFYKAVSAALLARRPVGEPRDLSESLSLLRGRMAEGVNGVESNGAEASRDAERVRRANDISVSKQVDDAGFRSLAKAKKHQDRSLRLPRKVWGGVTLVAVAVLAVASLIGIGKNDVTDESKPFKEYTTLPGQKAQIRLSDNTLVELNVASTLRVPESFGAGTRRVYLEGEARFTVIANRANPFIVNTEMATIEDLATVFNVRAYPESRSTSVAVTDGRVNVSSRNSQWDDKATVDVGEVVTVGADGATQTGKFLDSLDHVGWTGEVLKFNDVPLSQVVVELSRWYNVEYKIMDPSLATNRVTMTVRGVMLTNKDIAEFAEVIDANVTRDGNAVVLSLKGKSSR